MLVIKAKVSQVPTQSIYTTSPTNVVVCHSLRITIIYIYIKKYIHSTVYLYIIRIEKQHDLNAVYLSNIEIYLFILNLILQVYIYM